LSSKVHLAVDGQCRPVARVTSGGHRGDSLAFRPVLTRIHIRRSGPGRPRTRPGTVMADKAYSSKGNRAWLRSRGVHAVIPERADEQRNRTGRGSLGGRPPAFDKTAYRDRNTVERGINKLKQTGPWPPATTNATTSGAAPSTSPPSGSGSAAPSNDLRDTA
jgi:transposase